MATRTKMLGLQKPDVNDLVTDTIKALSSNFDILDKMYPIGTIYQSTKPDNPSGFLGGTWTRLEGRMLVGAGSEFPAGSVGGEKKHKLTKEEMPAHSHDVKLHRKSGSEEYIGSWGSNVSKGSYWEVLTTYGSGDSQTEYAYPTAITAGGDQPHNNMPPYKAVFMWERTA